jgi:hypothetical protein
MTEYTDAQELAEQHGGAWGEHPQYLVSDWQHEVAEGNTRLGYWVWVLHRIEADEDEDEG